MADIDIRRGDIFYINRYPTVGSEQAAGRPGIVVSNEANNRFSDTVEIVYLTTQTKRADLLTHVSIDSAPRPSQALCEQVTTVSVERLGDYIGHLTDAEMTRVDTALLVSLDLYLGEAGENEGGVLWATRKGTTCGAGSRRGCRRDHRPHDGERYLQSDV